MLPEILFFIIAAPAIAGFSLTITCARAHAKTRRDY